MVIKNVCLQLHIYTYISLLNCFRSKVKAFFYPWDYIWKLWEHLNWDNLQQIEDKVTGAVLVPIS